LFEKLKNNKFAIVMLNYITTEETKEALNSAISFYPALRILVVDNGSPGESFSEMMASYSHPVTSLKLDENLGFARGMNKGISCLRKEGFSKIICASSDVLFVDDQSLFHLSEALDRENAGVAGPAIITPKGRNQSPMLRERPLPGEAVKMVRYYSRARIYSRYILNRFVLSPLKKKFRKPKGVEEANTSYRSAGGNLATERVYVLNGALFALGPAFFENYEGLDPHTFLYGEELILGEMSYRVGLDSLYVPSSVVYHKEDRTSSKVWGSEDRVKPGMIAAESIKHWYFCHYLDSR
jgi:hypothetical protein